MTTSTAPFDLLAPARVRLAEAQAAVGRTRSPLLAWERLATAALLPFEHVDSPTRRFCIGRWQLARRPAELCDTMQLAEHDGDHMFTSMPFSPKVRVVSSRPMTVGAAARFVADLATVLEVEALAREAVLRLRAWRPVATFASAITVVWAVTSVDRTPLGHLGGERMLLLQSMSLTGLIAEHLRGVKGHFGAGTRPRSRVQTIAACAEAWELAATQGLRLGEGLRWQPAKHYGAALRGKRFSEVPNPFAPVVEIYKRGYAVRAITGDNVTLMTAQ
jgi:hypothetical protein